MIDKLSGVCRAILGVLRRRGMLNEKPLVDQVLATGPAQRADSRTMYTRKNVHVRLYDLAYAGLVKSGMVTPTLDADNTWKLMFDWGLTFEGWAVAWSLADREEATWGAS